MRDLGLVIGCAVLGLVIGSFLNVVIHRVPRGESVVSPPSRCPACGSAIRPYDNIPVLSWLILRGRCRGCAEPIGIRYPAVEMLTAATFAGMAVRIGLAEVLPAYLYLAAIVVALALIDIDVKRLPDVITLPSYVVAPALLCSGALLAGDGRGAFRALLGMAALYAVYFALAFAYPAGMGFGDVKLAGILGLYLGYLGWASWFVGWLLGFVVGGAFGVLLLALGRAGRKTQVPFGPFMIAGALVGTWWGQPIADGYLAVFGA